MAQVSSLLLPQKKRIVVGGGYFSNPHQAGWAVKAGLDLCGAESPVLVIMPTPLTNPGDGHNQELNDLYAEYTRELGPGRVIKVVDDSQDTPELGRATDAFGRGHVYVGFGGNSRQRRLNLLTSGVITNRPHTTGPLQRFLNRPDTVAVVGSASTNELFEHGITDTRPLDQPEPANPRFTMEDGLGDLPGSVCTHYETFHSKTGVARAARIRQIMEHGPIGHRALCLSTHAALILKGDGFADFYRSDSYQTIHVMKGIGGDVDIERFTEGDRAPLSQIFG